MKKIQALSTRQYQCGRRINVKDEGAEKLLANAENQEMLLITTKDDYRLIPLEKDVKKIYIEVTTQCNFSCVTCIRSSWKDSLEHMEWATFEHIREQLKEFPDLESVHFGGFGEPMMHPQICEMIRAVKELGVKVEMITNGSFLTQERIDALIDLELDMLFTSFDSPEEERYNEIRLGADFTSVLRNIQNLQNGKMEKGKTKPELGIEFVAMKQNLQQLPALVEMAHDLKVNRIIVSNLLPYHETMRDEIVYDVDDAVSIFGKKGLKTTIWAHVSNMKFRTERLCKFVDEKTLCINYKGLVSPCYALMHEYDCYIYGRKKHIHPCYVGDVNHTKLSELWMDSGHVNFRRHVRENLFPSCTDCKYREGCSYKDSNEMDCWGNSPSCGECLWARRIIACP